MTRLPLPLSPVLIALGVLLLVLPDSGTRYVVFSGSHGLTLLDAAGVGLLVAGWLVAASALWRRPSVRARVTQGRRDWRLPLLAGLGAGLVVAGVARDFEGWWVVGTALLLAAQIAVVLPALRRRR